MSLEECFIDSLLRGRYIQIDIQTSSMFTTSSSKKVFDDMTKFEFFIFSDKPLRFSWSINNKACLTACAQTNVLES